MTDFEYLEQAIKKGHPCPRCKQGSLIFEQDIGAICPYCGEDFSSWMSLFLLTVWCSRWQDSPGMAWRKWLDAHPDYNKATAFTRYE